MAKKKQRKTLDNYLHQYFYFQNRDEFVIFVVWGLFVSVFLLNLSK